MKKTAKYVDGFIVPVPKKQVPAYLKLAKLGAKVWLDHGAIDYVETMADDVRPGKVTSFPQSVKLKADEVVFFSWIAYKSRSHRDKVLKKVMADPRLTGAMNSMPFDGSRMVWGGFKTAVSVEAK